MKLIEKSQNEYVVRGNLVWMILTIFVSLAMCALTLYLLISGDSWFSSSIIFLVFLLYLIFANDRLRFDSTGLVSRIRFKRKVYSWSEVDKVALVYASGYKGGILEEIRLVLKNPTDRQKTIKIFNIEREHHDTVFSDHKSKHSDGERIVELMNEFRDKYSK